MSEKETYKKLLERCEDLKHRLDEAEDTLEAIRTGQVDAIVVENGERHQLYTLQSADQTYRVFIEKMKEGAVTLNREQKILYSNSQFASMVGLTLPEVIGRNFRDFIPPEFDKRYLLLMESGWNSDSKGELPLRRADGEQVPFLLSFTTLELDEGSALSIILTDLSMQKKTEQELVEKNLQLEEARRQASNMNVQLEEQVRTRTHDLLISREHFKFLADNIPVMVWTTDAGGKPVYFNQKWFEYTGIPYDEARTRWTEFVHPDDIERVRQEWIKTVNERKSMDTSYRLLRARDQEFRWHQVKGEPFFDEKGALAGWLGTTTDIEDQKKEIEKKDEFIGVASHELKTPLTSLKGYVQLIGDHPQLPESLRPYVSKANISMLKLQHLINDLLDVSKINAGKLQFSLERTDLSAVAHTTLESAAHMYPQHQIISDVEPGIFVMGNAERLEQVIMNLVSNAVKYSPANKEIFLRVSRDGDMICVSIRDKGIGLSSEHQQKIFDRFFRVEDNKFIASGLGMGLYIASQIIQEHGGEMGVSSRLNKGSEFFFRLPALAN